MDIKAVDQNITERFAVYQGDCCELIRAVPDESVHFGVHSPPFEGLFKFSNYERDISNNEGEAFWAHYGFLIGELFRVTKPGRLHAVHCMQLPTSKLRDGHIGMRDFRGDVIRAYCGDDAAELHAAVRRTKARAHAALLDGDADRHTALLAAADTIAEDLRQHPGRGGWRFHSEVCIWKDPVVAQQRTKSIRLLHKQVLKDSTVSGQGLADYIVVFGKPGDNAEPVSGPFDQFIGAGLDVSREAYEADVARKRAEYDDQAWKPWPYEQWVSILVWQRYASPVWMDINQTRTLQYRAGRDEKDEVHISPLQLDVIERCIELWSNPGDVVLTPFLGIGSEVYCAARMGRKGIGFEIKPSYFRQALKNLHNVENDNADAEPSLLSLAKGEVAA